ncbi:hypothetical protein Ndes2526B_g08818 [Nannochloris sp. 'desiccata']
MSPLSIAVFFGSCLTRPDAMDKDEEVVARPSTIPPRSHSPPSTIVVDDTPIPTPDVPEIVASAEPISTAAMVVTNPTLPQDNSVFQDKSVSQDSSVSHYKVAVTAAYNYILGFLPSNVPLCLAACFSGKLLHWATKITLDLDAGIALCCVNEEQLVIAIGFLHVSRDFIKRNPALVLSHPNIGLALDTLGLSIERCARALAYKSAQTLAIESSLFPAPMLLRAEAAAPFLFPVPQEVSQPADLSTAPASETSEAMPTSPAPIDLSTPLIVIADAATQDEIATVSTDAIDIVPQVSKAACVGKKNSAPRAPYYVIPRGSSGLPCPLAGVKGKNTNKCDKHAPPGLALEKRSPVQVAAAFAEYEKALDSVLVTGADHDTAPPPGFSKPLVNDHLYFQKILNIGTRCYHQAAVAEALGCYALAKELLETCLEAFEFFGDYAMKDKDFISPEEFEDLKLAYRTVFDKSANFVVANNTETDGEDLMVADITFLKLVLDGSYALNEQTLSFVTHLCNKFERFVSVMQADVLNGEKMFMPQFKLSVAAAVMAIDIMDQIEVQHACMITGEAKKALESLRVIVRIAEIKLESLDTPKISKNHHDNNNNKTKKTKKETKPRVSALLRLGASSSGPTSGDSTPMSNSGAIISLNEAANKVAGNKKGFKPTRRGGQGKKTSGQRRS